MAAPPPPPGKVMSADGAVRRTEEDDTEEVCQQLRFVLPRVVTTVWARFVEERRRDDEAPVELVSSLKNFPGFHAFAPPPRIERRDSMTTSTDECFDVYDDPSVPAPILSETRSATGCEVHGPFKCSCAFIQQLATYALSLDREFGIFESEKELEALPPPCCVVTSQLFEDLSTILGNTMDQVESISSGRHEARFIWGSSAEEGSVNERLFGFLKEAAGERSGSVFLYSPEIRSYAMIIANEELPLTVQRRIIGPFPATDADTEGSITKAANIPAHKRLIVPECRACRYRGVNLRRCFVCFKQVCGSCACSCAKCKRTKDFCPYCVITEVTKDGYNVTVCNRCD